MLAIDEGKFNLDEQLQKKDPLLPGQKSLDTVLVEKEIAKPTDTYEQCENPSLETHIVEMPQQKTVQPVIEDFKNAKCAETHLCKKPIKLSRKRKNMFDID